MEVVTKPVRSDYEENLVLFPIALVHAPIARLAPVRLYLVAGLVNVAHQNSRTFLAGVAAIDRKPDLHTIAFENDRRHGIIAPLDLHESKGRAVPLGGLVEVFHRQGEDVLGIRKSSFV